MSKRKTARAWVAYKIAKIGKRLGTVYGETEKEALASERAFLHSCAQLLSAAACPAAVRRSETIERHRSNGLRESL
jgi:hypothetical protein